LVAGHLGRHFFVSSKVKKVKDKNTKKEYALKYINKKDCIKADSTLLIFRERLVLQTFCHPNIVSLCFAFQDDDNLFLVLTLAKGGDLRFAINSKVAFDEWSIQVYTAQMTSAISYIHDHNYVHRDLKPENMLLDDNGHLYLTDFNLAHDMSRRKPTSQSGTLDYMGTLKVN
jgi:serine/threonine kinase 32